MDITCVACSNDTMGHQCPLERGGLVAERLWCPLYRVLGRALVMLVDNERPILFTTCRVGAKQPRRVAEHHLCELEQ